MAEEQHNIDKLVQKLEELSDQQVFFKLEIEKLRNQIEQLKLSQPPQRLTSADTSKKPILAETSVSPTPPTLKQVKQDRTSGRIAKPPYLGHEPLRIKADIEKFIGENLANKIGIVITIIGVAIGTKYAIEHQLISALTRILLGYLVGVGLLGFAIRLREKYKNFSAVLLSGAMAIMYFVTYAAYDFYGLIPQWLAFTLMVLFTIFTVIAAIRYNQQVIAHIGLVGAYAVPFLLSKEPGKVAILFSYITIINTGILVIAFRKYWKLLYYSAFVFTWSIFSSWYLFDFDVEKQLTLGILFLTMFFGIFYTVFLAYKIKRKELFGREDIVLLLVNSFIFYGLGYLMLDKDPIGKELLGLFTVINAVVHFVVAVIAYRITMPDRKLSYFITGLVLTFITMAIPVQLEGHWVTLLWVFEAAILFWIGRTRSIGLYEKLSYPIMLLAFFSIIHDWAMVYEHFMPEDADSALTPIFNINFLSSLLFIASFAFIQYIFLQKKYSSALNTAGVWLRSAQYGIPAIMLITASFPIRLEISHYYNVLYWTSSIDGTNPEGVSNTFYNRDLLQFQTIWVINYSLLFMAALSMTNIFKIKNRQLTLVNLILNAFVLLIFLTEGLLALSELRESYLSQELAQYYNRGVFHLVIRYISLAFCGILLWSSYQYVRRKLLDIKIALIYDLVVHASLLWVLSSELLQWMDIAGYAQSYKFGLSILWGIYALCMIAIGIWKHKRHVRIAAIGLFFVTLVKLFIYDITDLDTISKTILFVALGVLLLIISFLYNKYKNIIFSGDEH